MIFYLKPTTLKKMLTLSLNDMQSWQQASNYRAARTTRRVHRCRVKKLLLRSIASMAKASVAKGSRDYV